MTQLLERAGPDGPKPEPRRIAVVPAYNEEPTVAAVLERLYAVVDALVVVDDGSTDGTRAAIEAWLPGHEHARLLVHETNQGMSEAYYFAFSDLRRRMEAGEIDEDDLIFTVDADGQHELSVLDRLERITREEGLDALIVRRDLSTYPAYKQFGNWVMSTWATLWAGSPLPDVESGYRIFRMGALAHALEFYKGYKYSETVEVAVILCRLGYTVRNDIVVPVPIYRSRTNMKDVLIDLAVMPAAWWRVMALRAKPAALPSALAVWLPIPFLLTFVSLLMLMASRNIFLGVDSITNYVHVWYLKDQIFDNLALSLHAAPLENGRATILPYGGVPWLVGALLSELFGDRGVTLLMVFGLATLAGAATLVRPAMRSPWMMILFLLNPFFIDAVFSFQLPFIWAAALFFLFVIALDRRRYALAGLAAWTAVGAQPVFGGLAVLAYLGWTVVEQPAERRRLLLTAAITGLALAPVLVLTLETPALTENGVWSILRPLITDLPRRGLVLGLPFIIQAYRPLILRRYQFAAGALALGLALWLPFGNSTLGIAQANYTAAIHNDPHNPYTAFLESPAFVKGAHFRLLTPKAREEGYLYLVRSGGVLSTDLFRESQFRRSFTPSQYGCYLRAKQVDYVLVERDYSRGFGTNEERLLTDLTAAGQVSRAFSDPAGRYQVFDVRAYRESAPAVARLNDCQLRGSPTV